MTKDEALKMCLEYIETDAHERKYVRHAIKKALAQPEQEPMHYYRTDAEGNLKRIDIHSAQPEQEPVAWWIPKHKAPDMVSKVRWSDECEPLYTTPPQRTWVGLTDEEIKRIGKLDLDSNYFGLWYDFAKAIEAKLKEKNT